MTGGVSTWARERPVLAFYVLAFGVTWAGWVPQALHSRGLFPFDSPLFYVLGGVGPMVAAFVVLRVLRGDGATIELFGPLLRWRVAVGWYALALLGPVAIWLAALGLGGDLRSGLEEAGPLAALLFAFLVYLLAAVPEEVAWRGFALPRLQDRHGALLATLIVGFLWAAWHLPLLLNADSVMSTYPLVPYLVGTMAAAVLYTSLFNSTAGSVLVVTVFHAASNVLGPFVPAEAAVVFLLAVAIVVVFGPENLSRRERHAVRERKS